MAEVADDNREAKEAFLDSKMEKIRQRNRELQQRYLEIEADKQNAEENSNAALAKQLAQDGTVEKTPRSIARSSPRSNAPKPRKPKSDSPGSAAREPREPRETREPREPRETSSSNDQSRRQQRLSEDENPPPDPSYNFLFDRLRVGIENDEQRIQSRRHPSNYGGQDFSNVKNTIQIRRRHEREHPRGPPRNKMEMSLTMTGHERTQYEEWKRVQDQCDKERLARQKTASGEWRREWDRDKIIQDDDNNDGWRHETGPRGGRAGNRGCLFGRGGRDRDMGRDRDRGERGHRGRGGNNGGEMSPFPSTGRGRGHGPRRPPANKRYSDSSSDADMARSPTDRKVNVGRDFLQIRVNNDLTTSPEGQAFGEKKPAQQRPRRVGSGRVLSASSQSGDEKGLEEEYSGRSEAIKEDEAKVAKVEDPGKETEGSVDESAGGDESWEDLTTSGNESQDLSCPTDDGQEVDPIKDEVFQADGGDGGKVEVKPGENGVCSDVIGKAAEDTEKLDRLTENGEVGPDKGEERETEIDSEVNCQGNEKEVKAEMELDSDPKPELKMEEKQPEAKPVVELELKPEFKMEENESEAKPEVELELKPEFKMEENESEAKPEVELELKTEFRIEENESEAKPEVEFELQSEFKMEEKQSEAKPEVESEPKPEFEMEDNQPEAKPEVESKPMPDLKVEDNQPEAKLGVESEPKPDFQMEAKPEVEAKLKIDPEDLNTKGIGPRDDSKMEEIDLPASPEDEDGTSSMVSKLETLDLNCEIQIAANEEITSDATDLKDIKKLE